MSKRDGIYGEDAAAIVGMDGNKSAFYVQLQKTNKIDKVKQNGEAGYWKKKMEDIIAMEFSVRTDKKVRRDNKHFVHSEYPFMAADVERKIVGENAILLCKIVSCPSVAKFRTKKFPESYEFEAQHYLAVTGFDICYFAILVNEKELIIKRINRSEELIEHITSAEGRFWQKIDDKKLS